MRTLVHLSDLHFGRVDAALLQPLADDVAAARPDLVVVSGDLTQRARAAQFRAAAAFLARLPAPRLVVPGNHDVPLFDVVDRLLRPLAKFRRYIEPDLSPRHVDAELAVLGLNTARALVVKRGRVNRHQLEVLRDVLGPLDDAVVRVVVTHHPFDVGDAADTAERVGRADAAMRVFADCGVDVLLAGHLHRAGSAGSGGRDVLAGYQALVVGAGTATSTRGRGEANSYNVLRLTKPRVEVERRVWDPRRGAFVAAACDAYRRQGRGWARDAAAAPTA